MIYTLQKEYNSVQGKYSTLYLQDSHDLLSFLVWTNTGGLYKAIDGLRSLYPTTFKKFIKKYKLKDDSQFRASHYRDTHGYLTHKGEPMNVWTAENMKEVYTIEGILLYEKP